MPDFAYFSRFQPGRPRIHDFPRIHAILKGFWSQRLGLLIFWRFQQGRPEPLQNVCFYQGSCDFKQFWSQRLVLLIFGGFSLAAQNPSRMHDFTRLHAILWDFEANDKFCWFLRFSLAAQNSSRMHDFTRIHAILCDFEADGWFYWFFEVSTCCQEPLQNAWFYQDSCNLKRFWSQRLVLLIFWRFQQGRPEPLQNARFYQDSCNFKEFWSQRLVLLIFAGFSLAAQNPSRMHDFTRIQAVYGCILLYMVVYGWKLLYMAIFEVLAWPPRTLPECLLLPGFMPF